jgi:uncharacterized membrane protein YjjP (DUF1212 family)
MRGEGLIKSRDRFEEQVRRGDKGRSMSNRPPSLFGYMMLSLTILVVFYGGSKVFYLSACFCRAGDMGKNGGLPIFARQLLL